MTAKKIALFIDADNISSKFGKQIIEALESRGEIFIRRIYGNWEKISLHGWNECILNFSLRAVQQPDFVAGKNATDMSLVIDAMDVLYGGKAEIFAIVSNDSDFTPLVIRLRESGIKIIGMGNSQAANSFRLACNEFIDLVANVEVEIPVEPKKKITHHEKTAPVQLNLFDEEKIPAPVVSNPKVIHISDSKIQSERDKQIQQLHDIIRESAEVHGDIDGFSLLNYAGQEIKSKNLGFGVKDFGYNQLRDFIVAFPNLYEVRQEETGQNFCYRCLPIKSKASVNHDKLKRIHDVLKETAQTHGDEKGFATLSWAGDAIGKRNLSIKGSGYSTLSKFVSAFPNLYEVKGAETGISYRCLTSKSTSSDKLKQIHDVLRETAKAHADEKGFVNLGQAGNAVIQKNISIKDFGYGKLGKFISAFPNLYELKENSYRCK